MQKKQWKKEAKKEKEDRIKEILRRLKKSYSPQKNDFILWDTPLELVVGTVLSAQCTDVRVNSVTRTLFQKYKTPKEYARAKIATLEKEIGSITYFRSKARYLKNIGEILEKEHGGVVPDTMEELMHLPGVGKKTASLILAKLFGKLEGIAVDTHVQRVAPRLGIVKKKDATAMSRDLEKIVEKKEWLAINEYLIVHGRAICAPKKPKCGDCMLQDICPSAFQIE